MSANPTLQTHAVHSADLSSGHAVQFYETDAALIEAVGQHLGSGLELGDVAIVVATAAHRQALAEELLARGLDAEQILYSGRYIELDAEETLAKFLVNGWPDEQKFLDVIGGVVARAGFSATCGRRLLIFGEMVALLWAQGKRDATVRLEQLWNELAERYSFFCCAATR